MKLYEYGSKDAASVLIQPVDDHDLSVMESEISLIREMTDRDFRLIAVKVEQWNRDLSPWNAPPVFGTEGFGEGAPLMLNNILTLCKDNNRSYFIGGYSLAGLFALWAVYQTDIFSGAAAVSPSIWFPGFTDFMKEQKPQVNAVYLSLGDKEEKTRNPVMTTVGDCIRKANDILNAQGISCMLEWNRGNHFKNPDLRTAKGFAWLLSADSQA